MKWAADWENRTSERIEGKGKWDRENGWTENKKQGEKQNEGNSTRFDR